MSPVPTADERTPLKILEAISFTVAGPGRLATHSRRSARHCDLGFARGVVWFGLLGRARDTHLTCETVTQLCVQSAISPLRRWHRFRSHRSFDHRVSPSYFSLCLQRKSENEDIQTTILGRPMASFSEGFSRGPRLRHRADRSCDIHCRAVAARDRGARRVHRAGRPRAASRSGVTVRQE